jgi:hypothetical protein
MLAGKTRLLFVQLFRPLGLLLWIRIPFFPQRFVHQIALRLLLLR